MMASNHVPGDNGCKNRMLALGSSALRLCTVDDHLAKTHLQQD
jgi:hypothetical protein